MQMIETVIGLVASGAMITALPLRGSSHDLSTVACCCAVRDRAVEGDSMMVRPIFDQAADECLHECMKIRVLRMVL
jgi:hypothetical protein